ncbi:MAG: hypothetical protein SCJ94_08705 [Bacillota bacterium]|nr:hypothetical protein [Bacillota bacterium]
MDDNHDDLMLEVSILTYDSRLEDAKRLIDLASRNKETEKLLSACSIVLMATVLEQVTKTIISKEAKSYAEKYELPIAHTPQMVYLNKSLRSRMFAIPELMSSGKYTLSNSNRHIKMLHEIISLRNSLVHMEDDTYLEKVGDGNKLNVTINHLNKDNGNSISIEGIALPEMPWSSISLPKAQLCCEAIEKYIREIVDVYWDDPNSVDKDGIINSDLVIEF